MIYKGLELKPIRKFKKGELWKLLEDKKFISGEHLTPTGYDYDEFYNQVIKENENFDIFELIAKKILIVPSKRKFLIFSKI